jgi:hypothetical protein
MQNNRLRTICNAVSYPCVCAAGFHIRFDKQVSMLEPIWVPSIATNAWPHPYDSSGTYYETCLRLTLDTHALKNLAKLNQDIQEAFNGKLILFLNRLERMILEDRQRDTTTEYVRQQLSQGECSAWVQIVTTTSTGDVSSLPGAAMTSARTAVTTTAESFWLILRHQFAPQIHRLEVLPETTEVSIAFKFVKTGRKYRAKALLQQDIEAQRAAAAARTAALAEEALYSEQDASHAVDQEGSASGKKQHRGHHRHAAGNHKTLPEGDGDGSMPVQYVEEIRLDFSELLMPIYAFLPTSTHCFRFIVQGDFVLPTNRESILEQNDWNQSLFDKVPGMFAAAVRELALWSVETDTTGEAQPDLPAEELSALFPMLSQLALNTYYCLKVDASDVLAALPRRSHTSKDHVNRVITAMYEELQSVPFLRAQACDALCTPTQLCTVHHLDFAPAQYLPEELLFQATGLRYALHELGEYELDEELTGPNALRIVRFDTKHVVACLEYLSRQVEGLSSCSKDTKDSNTRQQLLRSIAGGLLLLDQLCQYNQQLATGGTKAVSRLGNNSALPNKQPPAPAIGKAAHLKALVPSQTLKRGNVTSGVASTSTAVLRGVLKDDLRAALRDLPIWPLADGSFATFEHTVVFLGGTSAAFTPAQQECFNVFSHRVQMLSTALLDAATECVPRGGEQLRSFLLDNFRPVKVTVNRASSGGAVGKGVTAAASVSSAAGYTGGVEALTPDVVLQRVIFPAYVTFAEQKPTSNIESGTVAATTTEASTNDGSTQTHVAAAPVQQGLDRLTAAAFLAFFFHCKWHVKLNAPQTSEYADLVRDVGVVVPVLTGKDSKGRGHVWDVAQLVQVRKFRVEQEFVVEGMTPSAGQLSLPTSEIHLGLELLESATSVLCRTHTVTAFRQLQWRIVDPLVAALAFRNTALRKEATYYSAEDVERAFRGSAEELRTSHWPEFLQRVGLVNFFGLYAVSRPSFGLVAASVQYETPYLREYVLHLLRNGKNIATSRTALSNLQSGLSADADTTSAVVESAITGADGDATVEAFLPLFLPSGADDGVVREVSKDVHEALMLVASLLAKELLPMVQSAQPRYAAVLAWLKETAWCPCEVSDVVRTVVLRAGTAVTPQMPSPKCLLAAPRDMFTVQDDDRRGPVERSFLQPHCAVLPKKLAAESKLLQQVFAFNALGGRQQEDSAHVLAYLQWLAAQGVHTPLWSNTATMVRFYQAIEDCVLRGDGATVARFTAALAGLLSADAPLVWIPTVPPPDASQQPELSQYEPYNGRGEEAPYVEGRMLPLSKLVKSDPSCKFSASDSPVKPLDLYYPPTSAALVLGMFTRTVYCYACQAREGMFGLHGCSTDAGAATSLVGPPCACRQGPFCTAITAKFGKPVRKSPSAADLVALLAQHCAQLRALNEEVSALPALYSEAHKGGPSPNTLQSKKSNTQRVQLEQQMDAVKKDIADILTTLSSNIWKCFQIRYAVQGKHSLHPYASAQLEMLQRLFNEKKLLPTLNYATFVSAPNSARAAGDTGIQGNADEAGDTYSPVPGKRLIAVDDVGAFQMFAAELAVLNKGVRWLEVHPTASANADAVLSDDTGALSGSAGSYDLQDLKDDETAFLNCSAPEFEAAVRFISPETFFAPSDRLALLEFLRIPKLSDSVRVEWVTREAPVGRERAAARLFVGIMNHLLTFTHAYYFHGGSKEANRNAPRKDGDMLSVFNLHLQLAKAPRVRALLDMDITECAVLERCLRLSLDTVVEERTVKELHHRVHRDGNNVLYVSSDATAEELQALAVYTLLKALRVELALVEVRQEPKEMEDLRRKLEQVAKLRDTAKLIDRLETFELTVPGEALASAADWQLAATARCTEATDEPTHPTDGSTDYEPDAAALEALAAYEKAQKQPRKTPASAKGVKEGKLANEAKFAQFKKEQTQQMKAQGELAAAQLVGGSTGAEVLPVIAGEAETAAVEDHRVKLEDSERARSSAPTVVTGITLGGNDGGDPSLSSTGPVVVLPVLEPPTPGINPAQPVPSPSAENGHSQHPAQGLQLPQPLPPFGFPMLPMGMPPPSFMPPFLGPMSAPVAQPPLPAWYVAAGGPFGPLGALPPQLQQRLGLPSGPYGHNGAGYPFGTAGTGSIDIGPFSAGPMSTGGVGIAGNGENGHSNGTVNRYNPLLAANDHASAAVDVIICDDLGALEIPEDSCLTSGNPTAVETGGDADRTGEASTHTRSNVVSGWLGEQAAVAHLQACRIRGEAVFSDVVWVNREAEAGLPYDIVVTLPNGTTKVCEVKTRSVPGHAAGETQDFASKQWVISPAEITYATVTKDAYFGMFLSVRIDYGNGAAPRLVQSAARIVGLERGLIHSIAVDRTASLFVQMNSA